MLGGLQILPSSGLAQIIRDAHRNLATHVTHDEGVLKLLPKALVHLAAEIKDLIQGLAATLETALEGIEETHYTFTTFPVSRSSFWLTTRLTPSACMETPYNTSASSMVRR